MSSPKSLSFIGILLSFFLYALLVTNLFGLTGHLLISDVLRMWISRIGFWLVTGIVFIYARKIEKNNFLLWKKQKEKLLFYILSIIIIPVVITVSLSALLLIQKNFGYKGNDKAVNNMFEVLCSNKSLLIFTCITAAFTEELIFRGYLLPRLNMIINNKWAAIIISSLLFGLAHIGYGDLNRMLSPFIIGIIFSWYYFKYRNLSVLIICHFFMDLYATYSACK